MITLKTFKDIYNQLHRVDGPAVREYYFKNGLHGFHPIWYYHNSFHRVNSRAKGNYDGLKNYFIKGVNHYIPYIINNISHDMCSFLDEKKACIYGDTYFYNDDGKLCEILKQNNGSTTFDYEAKDRDRAHTINGKLHREDGPAIIRSDGSWEYWINGMRHREDGPAVRYANGLEEYWVNGYKRSKEDFDDIAVIEQYLDDYFS